MKHRNLFVSCVIAVALCVAIPLIMSSCVGPQSKAAADEVARIHTEINADGVVTPEETKQYLAALDAWKKAVGADTESTNWGDRAFQIVLTLLGGGGAYVASQRRQQAMWGTPDAPKPTAPVPEMKVT